MELRFLKTRRVNHALWVELHNPPVNFLTNDLLAELYHVVKDADRDESLRVLVLTGGIEDCYIFHFSIPEILALANNTTQLKLALISRSALLGPVLRGVTTLMLATMKRSALYERFMLWLTGALRKPLPAIYMLVQMNATYDAIERSRKITIAAMNGNCMGGGTEMGACFDFRFMVGDADFFIGQPEVLVGIVAGGGGTQRVSRLIGKARALEFLLTCNLWSPQQAKQAGLITDHFPKKVFRASVQSFADRMSTRSPVACFETRRAIHEGLDMSLSRGLAEEMSATLHCVGDPGTRAALAEYARILKEQIDNRPDSPGSGQEIMAIAESERLTRHFKGDAKL